MAINYDRYYLQLKEEMLRRQNGKECYDKGAQGLKPLNVEDKVIF